MYANVRVHAHVHAHVDVDLRMCACNIVSVHIYIYATPPPPKIYHFPFQICLAWFVQASICATAAKLDSMDRGNATLCYATRYLNLELLRP